VGVAVAHTRIATISTDDHHMSQEFRASVEAQWPFDWDLGAPGPREAWHAGDLTLFHGWTRWSPERAAGARSV
jgi:hypothetical protein